MFITNLTAWNLEYIISIDSNRSQILRTNFEAQAVYIKIIINCSFITERTSSFHVISLIRVGRNFKVRYLYVYEKLVPEVTIPIHTIPPFHNSYIQTSIYPKVHQPYAPFLWSHDFVPCYKLRSTTSLRPTIR